MRYSTCAKAAAFLLGGLLLPVLSAPAHAQAPNPAQVPTWVSPVPADNLSPGTTYQIEFTLPAQNTDGALDPTTVTAYLQDDDFEIISGNLQLLGVKPDNPNNPTYYTFTFQVTLPLQSSATFYIGWDGAWGGVLDGPVDPLMIQTGD